MHEVERLFEERPRTEEELHERLEGHDPRVARRYLFTRLAEHGASPRHVAIYVRALRILGLSAEDGTALSGILLSPRAPIDGRAVALALLRSVDPARAEELARKVPASELLAMNDAQLLVVIAGLPQMPERLIEIATKIERQPRDSRLARFEQIDRLRRQLGVPATLLYADLLGLSSLEGSPAEDAAIDRIVEESGAAAVWLCETLFHRAQARARRDRFAAVLARLYQRSAGAPPTSGLCVEVFVGGGEGAGEDADERSAVISIESPVDGSFTLVTIHADEGGLLSDCDVTTLGDAKDRARVLEHATPLVARTPSPPSSLAWVDALTRRARPPAPIPSHVFSAACYASMALCF